MRFPFYKQPDEMDCGATCIRMIAKYYGRNISLSKLRHLTETTREGASLKNIANAVEKIGFRTLGIKVTFKKFEKDAPLPSIIHWNQEHFVVIYKIKKGIVFIADPAHGLLEYSTKDFFKSWIGNNANENTEEGVALLLEPTPKLKETEVDDNIEAQQGFSFLFKYLFRYKKFLVQLVIGLLAGSLLQLIFPFLTQSVVDVGIQNQDINFIHLILVAQLFYL